MGERERIKKIQGGREKHRTRDRGGTERERKKKMKRETVVGQRKIEIGRETRFERDRKMGREKERDRDMRDRGRKREGGGGEREKITNTKKFMEFYLVVLQSGYLSYIHSLFPSFSLSLSHTFSNSIFLLTYLLKLCLNTIQKIV